MGQVNLMTESLKHINTSGSFTLTSGLLSHAPIQYDTSAAMINSAVDRLVRGASIEMPKQPRINVVSPTLLTESIEVYGEYFKGFVPVSADIIARTYVKSVEGLQTGQVYKVGW